MSSTERFDNRQKMLVEFSLTIKCILCEIPVVLYINNVSSLYWKHIIRVFRMFIYGC